MLLWRMALHRLSKLSSALRCAVSLTLRRNMGLSAVLLNRAQELDPIQKLFLDKIRDYKTKSKSSGGIVEAGAAYHKNVSEEVIKLQRLYGGGDLAKFPDIKFTGFSTMKTAALIFVLAVAASQVELVLSVSLGDGNKADLSRCPVFFYGKEYEDAEGVETTVDGNTVDSWSFEVAAGTMFLDLSGCRLGRKRIETVWIFTQKL
ncbi:ATP synthase-coupling factor 6, mitochondrial [Liparis tanakae]|uniref:ATP synthase peripheral stalk subunit F6, mitochondrial n=1 Tax=Liparis tanakae TaxID=230148 RepID=A0A4Z2FGP0_9TELE|nr:ATP synthase-coupling factor 6, mitochondrial [Liparis tanakae]